MFSLAHYKHVLFGPPQDSEVSETDARTFVRVSEGRASGTEIGIPIGELVIGNGDGTGISFGGDPHLSPRHARITRYPTGLLLVEDLGSAGGTHLNGERILGPKQLDHGDVIVVGSTTLIVGSASSQEPSPKSATVASANPLVLSDHGNQVESSSPLVKGEYQSSRNAEESLNDEIVKAIQDSGRGPGGE
jgi:pSer/pThr/pTyr-binding forkhead associated (FHA) protein